MRRGHQGGVVPLLPRSGLVLGVATLAGLMMFLWPLLVRVPTTGAQVQPPFLFLALLPVVIVVVLAELSEGGMDSRALAVLGVLSAVNAVLRGVSAGVAGLELVFFLLILAGRVFGPGFGFVLGCTSLFASALLTGGVGPWLPYQMLTAAWVGLGAGLLPGRRSGRLRGRAEIALLVAYGVVAAYGFGLLMNMSSWPYAMGIALPGHEGGLSFVPGDPLTENLHRFLIYTLLTSTGGWDTGRAITNSVALLLLGPAVLATLRRARRRVRVVRVSTGAGPDRPRPSTGAGDTEGVLSGQRSRSGFR
ncbi:ECF transporter S component [Nocardioides mesophilus]|uniref:ECF transporter S component n=1 Tax=Nocardioides mesophilus TaxID=433659 RepID=A0A7G9R8X3_9ACTN|nr:ECF transporter S component [Nocardioides mesophilus]QNN52048.1 ECF transporter S component [Nocardioides mesophilus]